MKDKEEYDFFEQVSLSQIMKMLDDRENIFSSEDISKLINRLFGVKEKKESEETRKKQEEERKRRNRPVQRQTERLARLF